tara:strand:+ start:447 stop:644 length:198 start_codon:yes stop_codon:yes gene_type:complete
MGFFKKMIVDFKEDRRLKKENFFYSLYLENCKERIAFKDRPISFEEFIEGNTLIIDLYKKKQCLY